MVMLSRLQRDLDEQREGMGHKDGNDTIEQEWKIAYLNRAPIQHRTGLMIFIGDHLFGVFVSFFFSFQWA